jgi:hypothetical protein
MPASTRLGQARLFDAAEHSTCIRVTYRFVDYLHLMWITVNLSQARKSYHHCEADCNHQIRDLQTNLPPAPTRGNMIRPRIADVTRREC